MPSLTLNVNFNKNEGIIISPSELVQHYLHGIPLCTNDGREVSFQTIKQKIFTAQKQIENLLSIRLIPQVIEETQDFNRDEFSSFGFVKVAFLIREPLKMDGYLNNVRQITYPKDWLSIKRTGAVFMWRNLHLMPNTGSGATMNQNAFAFSGITPHMGFMGMYHIPNYWRTAYTTGWDKIPADVVDVVAKLATIPILAILGDILLGVGLTSLNVSLDGVSQSTSTTRNSSGGLFQGRIKQYTEELKSEMEILKSAYKGMAFEVL